MSERTYYWESGNRPEQEKEYVEYNKKAREECERNPCYWVEGCVNLLEELAKGWPREPCFQCTRDDCNFRPTLKRGWYQCPERLRILRERRRAKEKRGDEGERIC